MRKIYLASSWKNKYFEETFIALSKEHDMYNFKNPSPGDYGFNWSEVDSSWSSWNVNNFINRLNSDKAKIGFKHDYDALTWCDTGILLLPSGRSAHLEAGYLIGQGKQVYVYIPEYDGPDLMFKLATAITGNLEELVRWLR